MNGGTCSDGDMGTDGTFIRCVCPPGFTGDRCEFIIECADSPCVNGECTDEINGYTCVCNDGYTGMNCDQDIDECSIENPCANGNCINTDGNFTCDCEAGFTGTYCSEGMIYKLTYPES